MSCVLGNLVNMTRGVFAIGVLVIMTPRATAADVDSILVSIDDFLDRQLAKFTPATDYPVGLEQAQLIQSYDLPPTAPEQNYRADVYDSALAAIYYIRRDNLPAAKVLLDGMRFVQQFDPAVGNMSWAGIAMTQYYGATRNLNDPALGDPADYLSTAERIADWIAGQDQCATAEGISGGLSGWDQTPFPWMSTEHNVDAHALSRNLFHLTGQSVREAMADETQSFVEAVFDPQDGGRYLTGTVDCAADNPTPIPADTQSWTALAGIDTNQQNRDLALDWMWENLLVTDMPASTSFDGIKFSDTGSHIQSEQSTGAAMALSITGEAADAQHLLDELDLIRQFAPGADSQGIGIVATPWPGGAETGFGGAYPNLRHVASTVWTGLALLVAEGNMLANPLFPFVTALPGDANGDTVVNAGDYTIWADNFGILNPAFVDGDFSLDHMVGPADYTIWANNFGASVASPDGTPASVPEPSALMLAGLGLWVLAFVSRRTRARDAANS